MDIDSLNQVMTIENLNFVESLIVNRQYDAVDGFQEK